MKMAESDNQTTADNEKTQKTPAGRFVKGQKRPAGAGRKPGSRNKITRTVKETFEAVFSELQRDPKTELAAWARKSKANLREFYKLTMRLVPIEASLAGKVKVDLSVAHTPADRDAVLLETARTLGYLLQAGSDVAAARTPRLQIAPPAERDVTPAAPKGAEAPATDAEEKAAEAARRHEEAEIKRGDRLCEADVARELRKRERPQMGAQFSPAYRRYRPRGRG